MLKRMTCVILFASALALLSLIRCASAQEHLVPVPDAFGVPNEYYEKIRTLFQQGMQQDVVLRVLILESFSTESLVGIRKTAEGFEAFCLRAKTSIGDTELLKHYEKGQIFSLDRDGNRTPGVQTKEYQELKARTPADFRDIVVERTQRRLAKHTFDQIADIWRSMLRETGYPQKYREGKDGTNFYFAMRDSSGVSMSGTVWSPNESARTEQLVQLAETLRGYIESKKTEAQLNSMIKMTHSHLSKKTGL